MKCLQCDQEIKTEIIENYKSEFYHSIPFGFLCSGGNKKFHIHEYCEKIITERLEMEHETAKKEMFEKNLSQDRIDFIKKIDFDDSSFDFDNIADEYKKTLMAWDLKDNFGFILYGPAGCGKSYALAAMAKFIFSWLCEGYDFSIDKFTVWNYQGPPSHKITFIKSSNIFKSAIANDFKLPFKILGCPFLFIDDLGTENLTEFKQEILYELFDYRATRKMPTFISTNLTINQIRERFSERISSRILSICVPIEVTGNDRRLDVVKKRMLELQSRISADE